MAADLGGRTQPASGALNAKGDVRVMDELRGEAKYTSQIYYSLKLEDLEKITREAGLEHAVLQLCFMDKAGKPIAAFAILPGKAANARCFKETKARRSVRLYRDLLAVTLLLNGVVWISLASKVFSIMKWDDYLKER